VKCPICGEPDMPKRAEPGAEAGQGYIECVNLACASNGGENASALKTVRTLDVATARAEEKRSHLHDEVPAGALGIDELDGMCGSYVDARTFATAGLCVFVIPGEGLMVFTPEQARAAAVAIVEVANRVQHARDVLSGKAKL
jgi:hypothetical protein